MTHLFLFQIGPVQSFIAAGRRTADLYVGSRILSQLAKAGIEAARGTAGFKPIFPVFVDEDEKILPKGIPHRFAFISDGDPSDSVGAVGDKVKTAIRNYWLNQFAERVSARYLIRKKGLKPVWEFTFKEQRENWLEIYWVAVPYTQNNHAVCFAAASRAMAQRKLMRHFPQVEEPGRKCTLTGRQSALDLDWAALKDAMDDEESIVLRENEQLGTLALIKRLARKAECDLGDDFQQIISTREIAGIPLEDLQTGRRVEGYFAVLHMDGDKMGDRLRDLQMLADHQAFSRNLAEFAESVPEIIRHYGGATAQPVYAGGDDVLALLPLSTVLDCADELQRAFKDKTGCTASAGIAITPYNYPLDAALEMARQAEETAKEHYGRPSVFVTETHGSGQIREAGASWAIIGLVNQLYKHFQAKELSGKLGYDLLLLAGEMVGSVPPAARLAEVKRLLRQRTAEGLSDEKKAAIESLAKGIAYFGDVVVRDPITKNEKLNWESVAHWTILARFLAQPTREQVS